MADKTSPTKRTKVPSPPQETQSNPWAALSKARSIQDGTPRIVGGGQMEIPGVTRAANYVANKIDNPNGQGGYLRGLVAGGVQGLGNLVATSIDPQNVSPVHAAAPIGGGEGGPIARFLGWQRGVPEKGIPHTPMYNIEAPGHPLDRSTVTPATLEHHGIAYTPPPPPHWEDVAVTGQGEQVPSSYFNKGSSVPNPDVTMRDHTLRGGDNDRMARLVQKMGGKAKGKGPSDPRPSPVDPASYTYPPMFDKNYPDHTPDERQKVWDALQKSTLKDSVSPFLKPRK